jgi:Holliday junction resolvasome RuvABC endonuclease subunit
MLQWIKEMTDKYKYDIVIVEMPCFSQSAKSAIVIGILWGIISQLDCVVVEPSLLKRWSGSKSGDKKEKVKEKVLERIHVPKNVENNDDILDAIGLAFCFNDMIRQQKYVSTNS